MEKTIQCSAVANSTEIEYVKYGTMAYVRMAGHEVRACRCLGAKWERPANANSWSRVAVPMYEWEVAGMDKHYFTTGSRLEIGIIYDTAEHAAKGTPNIHVYSMKPIGELQPNAKFDLADLVASKYGMGSECFSKVDYPFHSEFGVSTYALYKDNTIALRKTDIDITIDENGVNVSIPMIDGRVDGIHRYPTYKAAQAAMQPCKVITFGGESKQPTASVIKVTLEVSADNVPIIKGLGHIIAIGNA